MSKAEAKVWTLAEFLAWEAGQERRHEFVGGEPRMMKGGTQAHSLINVNLVALLRRLLRGSPCRPGGPDLRVPIPAFGHSRYPDVTIDCGSFDAGSHDASDPRVVFEVLAKSTGWYDQNQKLRDYEAVPGIAQYVCISQFERRGSVWLRDDHGRVVAQPDITSEDGAICIAALDIGVPVRDIYEGIDTVENAVVPE